MRPSSEPIQIDNAVPVTVKWQKASLKDVCTLITDGTHYTPPNVGAGVPFLTVKDMNEEGLDFDGSSKISELEFERAATQNSAPSNGDVLFSKDGTVGKVHVVRNEQRFAVLSSIAILRPNKQILHPEYLAQFLRTPRSLSAASQRKTGSALTRIILKDIKQLEIPLPPLNEQMRIAAILDQAEKLRRLRERSIDRLNELCQAIFYHMFGNSSEGRYPTSHLEEVCIMITDGTHYTPPHVKEGIPFLTVKDMKLTALDFESCSKISPDEFANTRSQNSAPQFGDVLFSKDGTVGKVHVVSERIDFAVLSSIAIIRPNHSILEPNFLAHFLRTPAALAEAGQRKTGSALTRIILKDIKQLVIPIPPINEQKRFAQISTFIRSQLLIFENHTERLLHLFYSLQQRAFDGEL